MTLSCSEIHQYFTHSCSTDNPPGHQLLLQSHNVRAPEQGTGTSRGWEVAFLCGRLGHLKSAVVLRELSTNYDKSHLPLQSEIQQTRTLEHHHLFSPSFICILICLFLLTVNMCVEWHFGKVQASGENVSATYGFGWFKSYLWSF